MKLSDEITLAGVIVTASGSTLGMFGILLQTNGYYAFKWLQLFKEMFLVAKHFFSSGPADAWRNIQVVVGLAEKKGRTEASP